MGRKKPLTEDDLNKLLESRATEGRLHLQKIAKVNLSECGLTAAVLPELCNALPKSLQEVQLSGNLLGPQALDTLDPRWH
eukprot:g28787.t1